VPGGCALGRISRPIVVVGRYGALLMTQVDSSSPPAADVDDVEAVRQWLCRQGASAAQAEAATTPDHLNWLAADLAVDREAHLSARDLAGRLAKPVEQVVDEFRAHGIVVADLDAVQFSDADLRLVELSEESGIFHSPDGQVLSRVVATALDRVAEAAVALYVQGKEEELRQHGASLLTLVQKTSDMVGLGERLGVGMGTLFRHHLRQAIQRQRVSQARVTSRDVARIAVGFVDLVGSTAFGQEADIGELRKLVGEFESRAFEVAAQHGGRVVKFIGDEIMVAALDPVSGCRLLLALVDACCTGGMRPRGGLSYGEVLFRGGDYYGPEVNLASRLVDTAIPGEVLVAGPVVDAVADGDHGDHDEQAVTSLTFEPAGRRVLKGFADPLPVWSVTQELLGG
jgi:adenylate cyclase